MPSDRDRTPRDVGSRSPVSGSAKEQSMDGAAGGPQEASTPGVEKQPPQTSGRRPARHEHAPHERKSFAPDEDPSLQGKPNRSADSIRRGGEVQGLAGRDQASGTKPDDVQETADRE